MGKGLNTDPLQENEEEDSSDVKAVGVIFGIGIALAVGFSVIGNRLAARITPERVPVPAPIASASASTTQIQLPEGYSPEVLSVEGIGIQTGFRGTKASSKTAPVEIF